MEEHEQETHQHRDTPYPAVAARRSYYLLRRRCSSRSASSWRTEDNLTKPRPSKTGRRVFARVRIRGRCQTTPYKHAAAVTGRRSTSSPPATHDTASGPPPCLCSPPSSATTEQDSRKSGACLLSLAGALRSRKRQVCWKLRPVVVSTLITLLGGRDPDVSLVFSPLPLQHADPLRNRLAQVQLYPRNQGTSRRREE